jgi:hypothetical protein
MLKAAVVGAVVLTAGMTSFAVAETLGEPAKQEIVARQSGPIIRDAHIARLRTVLNLTADQQKYWAPVEAALRTLARQQAREESGAGLVQRMSNKARTVAGTAVQLRRLASAAAPLIRALSDGQKQNAISFIQSAGFGHLASVL